jgi:hypothetical protein
VSKTGLCFGAFGLSCLQSLVGSKKKAMDGWMDG